MACLVNKAQKKSVDLCSVVALEEVVGSSGWLSSAPEVLTFFGLFLLSDVIRTTVRRPIKQAVDAEPG